MAINLAGYLYSDNGTAITGADVTLIASDASTEATTTTSSGLWSFSEADEDVYDIKIESGSQVRYIKGADKLSVKEIDVRNNAAATTPAFTFTNYATSVTSHQVGRFRSLNSSAADGDEIYLSFNLQNSAGEDTEFARITGEAVDVTNGSEDGQLRFGVAKSDGTITDVLTINSTTGGSTDMTFDVSGDLTLDADGGDILFKDGGTTFGSATNTSGNLIIKSGTTTSLTFSGANLTAAGTIGSGAITSTGVVTGTGFTIGSAVIVEAELETIDGVTAGTVAASKAVVVDSNKDIGTFRNITIDGTLSDGNYTFDTSGNVSGLGTIGSGAITSSGNITSGGSFIIGSASIAEAELEMIDGITAGTAAASKAVVLDGSKNIATIGTIASAAITASGTSSFGTGTTIGNLTLANGSITDSGGALDFGNETLTTTGAVDFGAATVDSLSVSDANITNVADIALDSISADGTDINVAVTDNSATALTIKQGSDAYLIVDTANSSESVSIGTGISGTVITLGHGTSEVTVADNLTVTGDLTVSGTTTTVASSTLTIGDTLIKLGQAYTGSAYDQGIVFTRGDGSNSNTANRAILWDESADIFVFANTNTEAGTTSGNVTLNDYASIRVGAITADDNSTFTGTIATATGSTIGNLTLANGSITDSSGTISFGNENISTTGTATLATVDIGAGAIDGTTIGAASAAAGTFAAVVGTTGTFSGVVDITDTTDSSDASGDTGALRTEGGASIAKKLYVGTDLDVDGTAELDNITIAGSQGSDGNVLTSTGSGVAWEAVPSASIALDDVGTGDGATTLATTVGNITIDAQANDADVIIKVDDAGSAVTAVTFDGSDEGNAIFVNDVQLKSDGALLEFGADLDTTLTHTDGTGLTLNSTNKLAFGDTGTFIHQSSDGVLTIESDTTVDINGAVVFNGAITGATAVTVDDVAINGKVITMTGDTSDTVVFTAGAAGTLSIVTTDAAGTDGDVTIDADGEIVIDPADAAGTLFKIAGTTQLSIIDGAILPTTNNDIDLGSDAKEFKNVWIDGTLETDNITIGGAQGSDGQVLTSTGSGVAWEDASGGASITDTAVIVWSLINE